MHHHAAAVRAGVVALSMGAAFLYALTAVLQHRAVADVPAERTLRLSFLVELIRRPAWLLTVVADLGAYVLQFIALRAGSLVTVQVLLVAGLLFALPLGAASAHLRARRADWVATVVLVAGLALFLAVAQPGRGSGEASGAGWAAVFGVSGVVVAALLLVTRHEHGSARAASVGGASGIVFGVTAAVGKASGHLLDRGLLHALTSWEPYALAASAVLGLLLSQSAFNAGPLQASLPALTIADPVVAAIIGLTVFHEHLAGGGAAVAGELVSAGLILVGAVALARSPLVAGVDIGVDVDARGGDLDVDASGGDLPRQP